MNLRAVLGIALAEARTIRRLVRYWLFALLSVGIGLLAYGYYGTLHGLFSSYSGSVGAMNPKFILSSLGLWQMVLLLVGIVFLAFDVRARDERERVSEVLDVRPYGNVDLLCGRLLATCVMSWLPLAGTAALVQLFGAAASLFGWPVGETIEWRSLLTFVTLLAVPSFLLAIAFVYFVTMLVRNRFLAAFVSLGTIGGVIFLVFRLPIYLLPAADPTGTFLLVASEVAPRVFDPSLLPQRGAVLFGAAALLLLAAALHPRRDDGSRMRRSAAGGALLLIALSLVGGVALRAIQSERQFDRWQRAHEARRGEPAPDLLRLSGDLDLEPGRTMRLELELRFAAPPHSALEQALFSLNPGLDVAVVTDAFGGELSFRHADGLLEIELPELLPAGEETGIVLGLSGRPDPRFAYLDAVRRVERGRVFDAQIALLGFEAALFERRYVALMPAIRWLPAPGSEAARNDPRLRPRDLFELELEVEAPQGWRLAGPGQAEELPASAPDRQRLRFAPSAPLPEVALVGARFERRTTEVEGVELEILLHPEHAENLDLFAEAAGEIRDWVGTRLREAAELGLPYPYGSLTLVEIPNRLRGWGGGWQLETVQAPPGMLLLRETGFPTSRFDFALRDPERFEEREGGIARAKLEMLARFFENDFNGGNVFHGASRNFLLYQAAARGREAIVLDFLAHELSNRLVTGKRGYFSAHLFDRDLNSVIPRMFQDYFQGGGGRGSVAASMIRATSERPEVWDRVLGVALADMDPWEDPARSVDVLTLKGGAIAASLLDGLGREAVGELLAVLRRRHSGGSYTFADLETVATELGAELDELVGDFLHQTALPGFVASTATLHRLPDTADGLPQYQVLLRVHNGEDAPGLLRIRYSTEESGRLATGRPGYGLGDEASGWHESDPFTLPGGESRLVGLVLSEPPRRLLVAPYLSLNREPFPVSVPSIEEDRIVAAEPFVGEREIDWRPPREEAIFVDDLDDGFDIEGEGERTGLRLGGLGTPGTLDRGLPVYEYGGPPPRWSRHAVPGAWGRYRHTVALVRSGAGNERAVFTAELPHGGRWQLELHMPFSSTAGGVWRMGRSGTYDMTLVDGTRTEEIHFDASAAEPGWNDLGSWDLSAGAVELELSSASDGSTVIADAIRWLPRAAPESPSAGGGDG